MNFPNQLSNKLLGHLTRHFKFPTIPLAASKFDVDLLNINY